MDPAMSDVARDAIIPVGTPLGQVKRNYVLFGIGVVLASAAAILFRDIGVLSFFLGLCAGLLAFALTYSIVSLRHRPYTVVVGREAIRLWSGRSGIGTELDRAEGGLLRVVVRSGLTFVTVIDPHGTPHGQIPISAADLPAVRAAALARDWGWDTGSGIELPHYREMIPPGPPQSGTVITLSGGSGATGPGSRRAWHAVTIVASVALLAGVGMVEGGVPVWFAVLITWVDLVVVISAYYLFTAARAGDQLRIGEWALWLDTAQGHVILMRQEFEGFRPFGPFVRLRTTQGRTFAIFTRKSAQVAEQALIAHGWIPPR